MPKRLPERIPISKFKTHSLALLERVRSSGRSIIVTRRGEPIAEVVPPSSSTLGTDWIGSMQGTARLRGDLVAPATKASDWEVLGS